MRIRHQAEGAQTWGRLRWSPLLFLARAEKSEQGRKAQALGGRQRAQVAQNPTRPTVDLKHWLQAASPVPVRPKSLGIVCFVLSSHCGHSSSIV